jgi:hypothetical protein
VYGLLSHRHQQSPNPKPIADILVDLHALSATIGGLPTMYQQHVARLKLPPTHEDATSVQCVDATVPYSNDCGALLAMIELAETEYVLNPMQCASLQYGNCASDACNYDNCVPKVCMIFPVTRAF